MTVHDQFVKGVKAFQSGDLDQAEQLFRQCIAAEPGHAPSVLNLGVSLLNRKAYAEAEPYLEQAVQLKPGKASLTALAGLLDATGRPAEAEACLRRVLDLAPGDAATLRRIAELHERHSNRPTARASYRTAWEAAPSDITAGLGYARTSLWDAPEESVRVLEHLLANFQNDDRVAIRILEELLVHKEWLLRVQHNLMPQHATSLADLNFRFCKDEFARYSELSAKLADENPNDMTAIIRRLISRICAQDWRAAQRDLDLLHARPPQPIWKAVTFDPAFYEMLENTPDADLLTRLPPVLSVAAPVFADRPTAYLACDHTYFAQFAAPMLLSLADKAPGAQVHVHIMDASDDQLADAAAFCRTLPGIGVAISAERPGIATQGSHAARAYYHAIRFVRFYQHLMSYDRPLWLMDVDALFNRDPKFMYDTIGANDIAFRVRPGRLEPWNQFNACIVGAQPTAAAKAYFHLIAAYLVHHHRRNELAWGIDQIAMYGVFTFLQHRERAPALAFLDDRAIDYLYLDDGVVWCNSGKNKFAHARRKPDGSLEIDDPDRARYIALFDKYCPANG